MRLLAALRKDVAGNPNGVTRYLEATDHYWILVYCFLPNRVYRVHVASPIQSDAVRSLSVRESKADHEDDASLAELPPFTSRSQIGF